jgi:hypothetical protein
MFESSLEAAPSDGMTGVSNAQNLLPPDWTTIDKLTRLEEGLLDDGVIRPELKRNEVSKLLRLQTVNEDDRTLPASPRLEPRAAALVSVSAFPHQSSCAAGSRRLLPSCARCSW